MLLVPKQLQRVGMTGYVPYYGGRLTPAHAYAASHAYHLQPGQPGQSGPPGPPMPPGPPGPPAGSRQPVPTKSAGALEALQHLLDTGVITPQEYQELRARVTP